MILIQASDKALGWFRPNSWQINSQDTPEITISAQCFNQGVDEIMDTILHEMAHLWNHERQVVDCNSKQVHNIEFKRAAELFGLQVSKVKRLGFAQTHLGNIAKKAIAELCPKKEVYEMYYNQFNALKDSKDKEPKKEGKLSHVIIGNEVKDLIKQESESLQVTQKELTEKAVKFYLHMLKNKPKLITAEFQLVKE